MPVSIEKGSHKVFPKRSFRWWW